MPDDFDRASELEEKQRDDALRRHHDRPTHHPLIINGKPHCLDCSDEISARVKIYPDAVRCLFCQERFEKQLKMEL